MKRLGIIIGAVLMLLNTSGAFAQDPSEVQKKTPDLPGEIVIDFGYNLVDNDTLYSWFRSRSFSIYFVKSYDVSDKLEFRPGIGWSSEKITVKPSKLYAYTPPFNIEYSAINKFTHAINYIHIPVELRFNSKGNDSNKGFYVGVGGQIDLRVEDHFKMIYKDADGNSAKVKVRQGNGINTWRLGASARVGWRSLSLFYKYYFTDIHSDNYTNVQTFGISLTGL